MTDAAILRHCFDAAVVASLPANVMPQPLNALPRPNAHCWLLSVGKAAPRMARCVVEWLHRHGEEPGGGLVVGLDAGDSPHRGLRSMAGDHPLPGAASARAADAIAEMLTELPAHAEVHVMLSGGASAMIAAPRPGISSAELATTFDLLLRSGLDIHQMNAIRKRVTRWGGGRLAVALAPRTVHLWLISDVPGDDPATIGSGPCSPDDWDRKRLSATIADGATLRPLPQRVLEALADDLPAGADRAFAAVTTTVVATNRTATQAVVHAAKGLGYAATIVEPPLRGDAAAMGAAIVAASRAHGPREILIWGGETSVRVGEGSGRGGRSQELALAAAGALAASRSGATLLAAGTDGRDGDTDAAGAVVDAGTWGAMIEAGRDPGFDLARHDAYHALDAVGALLRTGATGTNVMDLVLAMTG